jgi:hypothetical protein
MQEKQLKTPEEITQIRKATNKMRKDYLARMQVLKEQMAQEDCIKLSLAEIVDLTMNQKVLNLGKYQIVYDEKEPTLVTNHFKITFNREFPNDPS